MKVHPRALALPVLLLLGVAETHAEEEGSRPPNIILIVADDLGYGDLACFADTPFATPQLDRMAAEGVRLTDFHSNGAVCSPTRAALMTGRYQQRCGIAGVVTAARHRHTGMPPEERTLAEAFKTAGYATALFGKWHLGYDPAFGPNVQGFDLYRGFVSGNVDYLSHVDQSGYEDWWQNGKLVPEDGYLTTLITDHASKWIEAQGDKPLIAVLAHGAPHYPYQGPGDPGLRSKGKGMKADRLREGATVDQVADEMIEVLDAQVGRILDQVRKSDQAKNTLVVFISDNGPAGKRRAKSSGGLRGAKGQPWEGGHRVPAIAWWPGHLPNGKVLNQTAMTMDLMPTFLNLAGVKSPKDAPKLDGVDLSGWLLHGTDLDERTLFWGVGRGAAVRQGRWKAVRTSAKANWQLFDLQADLAEINNLGKEHPERLAELIRAWDAWKVDVAEK